MRSAKLTLQIRLLQLTNQLKEFKALKQDAYCKYLKKEIKEHQLAITKIESNNNIVSVKGEDIILAMSRDKDRQS